MVEEKNGNSYVKDICCKKILSFQMQNFLAHLKTAKHKLAVEDDKNSKIELQKILDRVNTSRASNPEASASNKNMDNSTKIKID